MSEMFRRIIQLVSAMTRAERWTLAALIVGVVLGVSGLLRQFYVSHTILVPKAGGTYIEGSVGELQPLNPWFIVQNDVNRDIVSLVFAGLLRYNPQTKKIEEDLATMKVSADNTSYTLTLKDNIFWQDTTQKTPHPVTADDVVFTFQMIQQQGFPNPLLQQNFRGVTITKVDDRTVRFDLDEPYSFFPSNLTLGLVPKNAFDGIPVNRLDQATDFGYKPVGAGPYKVKTIVQTDLTTEVTLERFDRKLPPEYLLDRVVFRIYPDYSTLASDFGTLQGVRLVPRNKNGEPLIPKRFVASTYTLPQYVALFFNLARTNLQDDKLRLGLQLGTNKQQIVDTIHEPLIVDTPLLEIDVSDWRYQYDREAAQGALFASRWSLPEKLRLQRMLERRETNSIGGLRANSIVYLQTGAVLALTGSLRDVKDTYTVNGHKIEKLATGSGGWLVTIPTKGSGALKFGENLLRLADEKGKIIDSFYVFRSKSLEEYSRARIEQALVEQFVKSKDPKTVASQRISAQDLALDHGMLRRRTSTDPVSIRTNEKGDPLRITLLTSPSPPEYRKVAEQVAAQWATLGVEVKVDVPGSRQEFQDRLLKRDYDVLLFGQSLLDNLDAFPYWHSTGMQKLSKNMQDLRSDAYNLSQYGSFPADSLLEEIRRTSDDKLREKDLGQLRDIMKNDVPAIFLYSPTYVYAHRQDVQGIELGSLSLHSDRFLTLSHWYVNQKRVFREGHSWSEFPSWLVSLL